MNFRNFFFDMFDTWFLNECLAIPTGLYKGKPDSSGASVVVTRESIAFFKNLLRTCNF